MSIMISEESVGPGEADDQSGGGAPSEPETAATETSPEAEPEAEPNEAADRPGETEDPAGGRALEEPRRGASTGELEPDPAAAPEPRPEPEVAARDVARTRGMFTRSEASIEGPDEARFRFARWTQPIAPAFFGFAEDSVETMATGFREAAELAGLGAADEDPELGANILIFACEEWAALRAVPHLARLIPDLERLTTLLAASGANQYRIFTFGPDRGIRLCVLLLRYDGALAQLSAPSLALGQAVQCLLLWSDEAFGGESPVTLRRGGKPLVRSRIARLLKAAYAEETPAYSEDPALAEALTARMDALRAAEHAARRGGGGRGRRDAEEAAPGSGSRDGDATDAETPDAPAAVAGRAADEPTAAEPTAAESTAPPPEAEIVDPLGADPRPAEEPETGEDRGA